jgi:outer membrane protein assembly factor BamB
MLLGVGASAFAVGSCETVPVDAPSTPVDSAPSAVAFGELLWIHGGVNGAGRPAFDSTVVFFTTSNRVLLAIDKSSGRVVWRETTPTTSSSPFGSFPLGVLLVRDNVVVVEDGLAAFDRKTGALRWHRVDSGASYATSSVPGASLDDTLFASSTSGHVVAVQGSSGEELWRLAAHPLKHTTARGVTRFDGALYVGWTAGAVGGISAVDISERRVRWWREFKPERAGVSSARSFGRVAVVGSALFTTASDGTVYRLNRETGSIDWIRVSSLPPDGIEDERYLDASGDVVIVTSYSGWIEALDGRDGRIRWSSHGGRGSATFRPVIAGKNVFVTYAAGQLVAFDLTDGRIRWRGGEGGSDRVVSASTVAVTDVGALFFGGVGAVAAVKW